MADERSKKDWRRRYLPEFLLYHFRRTIVFVLDVALSLKRFAGISATSSSEASTST